MGVYCCACIIGPGWCLSAAGNRCSRTIGEGAGSEYLLLRCWRSCEPECIMRSCELLADSLSESRLVWLAFGAGVGPAGSGEVAAGAGLVLFCCWPLGRAPSSGAQPPKDHLMGSAGVEGLLAASCSSASDVAAAANSRRRAVASCMLVAVTCFNLLLLLQSAAVVLLLLLLL